MGQLVCFCSSLVSEREFSWPGESVNEFIRFPGAAPSLTLSNSLMKQTPGAKFPSESLLNLSGTFVDRALSPGHSSL